MIGRHDMLQEVQARLGESPAVALLGPRQVGKTTLALEVAEDASSIYLDLESPSDRNKLTEPELYLRQHLGKLVILDEIHLVPDLFAVLRGLIDEARRGGEAEGRYLKRRVSAPPARHGIAPGDCRRTTPPGCMNLGTRASIFHCRLEPMIDRPRHAAILRQLLKRSPVVALPGAPGRQDAPRSGLDCRPITPDDPLRPRACSQRGMPRGGRPYLRGDRGGWRGRRRTSKAS